METTDNVNEMSLEQGFSLLDQITADLEKPDLSLEERFEYYKKGMELIRACTQKIDLVEKKMKLIGSDGTEREIE